MGTIAPVIGDAVYDLDALGKTANLSNYMPLIELADADCCRLSRLEVILGKRYLVLI